MASAQKVDIVFRGWAKPETKNWYRFKNFLIYVRLPLFEYCSIGPSLLSLSVSKSVLHDQWELLSLSEYPTLSEIYIQEIGRHYRLDRIFFLVSNLLFLVIEINEQEFKIDVQNSYNNACFLNKKQEKKLPAHFIQDFQKLIESFEAYPVASV